MICWSITKHHLSTPTEQEEKTQRGLVAQSLSTTKLKPDKLNPGDATGLERARPLQEALPMLWELAKEVTEEERGQKTA